MKWQRHQLAWLSAEGWQAVRAGQPDEPAWPDAARDCLQHWSAHDLPLVVTRQAAPARVLAPVPAASPAPPPALLTLGLAAPTRWDHQRLFVRVAAAHVRQVGAFPLATEVTAALPSAARKDWRALCVALEAAGIAARVYGSHGWQLLSGLACVREGWSDLDLLLPCITPAQADAAVAVLRRATPILPRLDGECVFANGAAVAWREWAAWRAGTVRQVLVKRLHGAALESVSPWAVAA